MSMLESSDETVTVTGPVVSTSENFRILSGMSLLDVPANAIELGAQITGASSTAMTWTVAVAGSDSRRARR